MSIIHDALKKVQTTAPQPNGVTPQTPAPAQVQVNNTPLKPAAIILMTLLATVVIVMLAVLFKLAMATAQRAPVAGKTSPSAVSATVTNIHSGVPPAPVPLTAAAPAPGPAPTSTPPAPFKIEGIMDMGDKKVALINGNVYEEGQAINGLEIAEIGLDHVTILENNTRRVIPRNP